LMVKFVLARRVSNYEKWWILIFVFITLPRYTPCWKTLFSRYF